MRQLSTLDPRPDVVVTCNDLVAQKDIRRVVPAARIISWLQNECFTHPSNVGAMRSSTDLFMTCSGYVSDWTARHYGIPTRQISTLGNGVSLDRFEPRPDSASPAPPLRSLFIGRIDPNKGPDLAADAVAALRDRDIEITFTVAGGVWFYPRPNDDRDPFLLALKDKINALGPYGTYLGHVPRDRVPALVREHDIAFVLSRSQEPFGLVVLEAMASGLAVIASNRGGIPEAAGGAALLVDPDKPEEILAALKKLATDHEFLAEQKRKSLARAQAAGWPVIANRFLEICGMSDRHSSASATALTAG